MPSGAWGRWPHVCTTGKGGWMNAPVNLVCLFIGFRAPAHGMVPLVFRVAFPKSFNPIWKFFHRHGERFISSVILEPVRLVVLTSTSGAVCQTLIVTTLAAVNIITTYPGVLGPRHVTKYGLMTLLYPYGSLRKSLLCSHSIGRPPESKLTNRVKI